MDLLIKFSIKERGNSDWSIIDYDDDYGHDLDDRDDDDDDDDYGHDLDDDDDDQLKKGEVRIGPLLPHTSSPAPRRREGQIQFPN